VDEVPQEPQEEQPQQPEAPPAIDPRAAIEITAQQYGVTPDYLESAMRLQSENQRVYEENRRRARELEIRQAQIDALEKDRSRYAPPEPTPYDVDPAVRPLYEKVSNMERLIMQEREERANQDRREFEARRTAQELNSHIDTLMRQVPTQNRIEPDKFYSAMAELWPNAEFQELGITPAQAVERTARYLGIQASGVAPQGGFISRTPRDPRAQFIVPMTGTSPPTNGSPPPTGQDFAPQRPNESTEQYHQRLLQGFRDIGTMRPPDGTKVSSGW
jgi:hypothetical protein